MGFSLRRRPATRRLLLTLILCTAPTAAFAQGSVVVDWYQQAAEEGDPEAQFNLGYLFETGLGAPHDLNQAMAWYRRAAALGQAEAQLHLGLLLIGGPDHLRNVGEGLGWLAAANSSGSAVAGALTRQLVESGRPRQTLTQAAARVRQLILDGEHGVRAVRQVVAGLGGAVRAGQAQETPTALEDRALKNDPTAQFKLAVIYLQGEQRPRDAHEGLHWLRQAADNGHGLAAQYLERMEENHSVQGQSTAAVDWLKDNLAHWRAGAAYQLGYLYERGRGVPQDSAEARAWYGLASAMGHTGADAKAAVVVDVQRVNPWTQSHWALVALAVGLLAAGAVWWRRPGTPRPVVPETAKEPAENLPAAEISDLVEELWRHSKQAPAVAVLPEEEDDPAYHAPPAEAVETAFATLENLPAAGSAPASVPAPEAAPPAARPLPQPIALVKRSRRRAAESRPRPAPSVAPSVAPTPLQEPAGAARDKGKETAELQFNVAEMLLNEEDSERNAALASRWYTRAASQNHPVAQFRLWELYHTGRGVRRDTVMAQLWLQRSAEAGYGPAAHLLRRRANEAS